MLSILRPILVAALLSAAVPAAASAAAPPDGAVFGGATYQVGNLPQPITALYAVREQGDAIAFRTSGYYRCPVGTRIYGNAVFADVAADGSFKLNAVYTTPRDDGSTTTTTNTGSGTVTADKISGSIRSVLVIKDAQGNETARCDTQDLPFSLVRKRLMAGSTSQRSPLILSRRRSGVPRSFLINWQSKACKSPADATVNESTRVKAFNVGKGGRFTATGTQSDTASNGRRFTVTYSIRGRLGRQSGRGTWRASESIDSGSGEALATGCDSGPVAWTVTSK